MITEMTVHLNRLAFLDHLVKLFSSNTDQGFLYSFSAAVAVELRRNLLINLHIKTVQYFLQKTFRSMPFFQKAGNRSDLLYILFQFRDRTLQMASAVQ